MICFDTTVLIDEFRAKGDPQAPVNRALLTFPEETVVIPAIAAGEFLDGAAMVSDSRFQEGLQILSRRNIASADWEVSQQYGKIVAHLRKQKLLRNRSPNDLWIAATSLARGARLLTRNSADFEAVPDLQVLGYGQNR